MSWLDDGRWVSRRVADELAHPDGQDPPVVADRPPPRPAVRAGSGPSAEHPADVLEQPRGILERPLVPPEPQQLAAQGQDRPEVDGRADVLLPPSLEHECRVEDHQSDGEQHREYEHARGEEIPHPRRIVSTVRDPWDSFLRLRPDSVPQVPGCDRQAAGARVPPAHRRREPGEPYDRENPYHSLHRHYRPVDLSWFSVHCPGMHDGETDRRPRLAI